jgi:hypothetical protein
MLPFTSDINLDGLVAKNEYEYSYKDISSNVLHHKVFSFNDFNNMKGLWVFEFTGNGISTRAVI